MSDSAICPPLKFLRRDDWWDNNKMRAKKNVAEVEDVRYLRPIAVADQN